MLPPDTEVNASVVSAVVIQNRRNCRLKSTPRIEWVSKNRSILDSMQVPRAVAQE
jgi:hypothetical protein